MADVSHTSQGYPGTVDAVAEAKRFAVSVGVPFKAASSADWAVTAYSSSNRTVQVAAGTGVCCGVRDITAAAATLTVATNTSGSTRNDVVIASFNWSTNATTFSVLTGTSASIPTINTGGSVVAGQINRIPGVQYDAVLAVVTVPNNAGVLSSGSVLDRRPWGSAPLAIQSATNGFLTAIDVGSVGQLRASDTSVDWLYTGGTWARRPVSDKVFSTTAARDSFFSGTMTPVAGDRCVCLKTTMTYDGTGWRFMLSGSSSGTTDSNGYLSFAHGAGQAPVTGGWVIAPGLQASDALNQIISILSNNTADAVNLGVRAVRTDTNAYLVSNPISVYWTAQF